jgi:predicted phage terminase large subunit-like protein
MRAARSTRVTPPTKLVKVSSIGHRIELDGDSAVRFAREVGFRLRRKQERTTAWEYCNGHQYWFDRSDFGQLTGTDGYLARVSKVTRKTLDRVDQTALYDRRLLADEVVEVLDGEAETFDFCIPDTHSYFTNGLISHNTPKGKNHFYELYKKAQTQPGWACFQFKSRDNPFLSKTELEAIVEDYHGSTDIMRRELEASFESYEGALFKEEWLKYGEEPENGDWHVAVDLAGFESTTSERGKSGSRLDETVICAVKTSEDGWYVGDFQHGRWDTRENATRILKTCRDFKPRALGIEEGALKNAVMPYLNEQMRTFGIYPRVEGLKHGGRNKTERIQWALQGRFEKGRVLLKQDAEWKSVFLEQYMDFPNPQAHDDMMDALAYVDQLAVPVFIDEIEQEQYQPFDLVAGY